jgi:hypothetical protein
MIYILVDHRSGQLKLFKFIPDEFVRPGFLLTTPRGVAIAVG